MPGNVKVANRLLSQLPVTAIPSFRRRSSNAWFVTVRIGAVGPGACQRHPERRMRPHNPWLEVPTLVIAINQVESLYTRIWVPV